MFVLRMAAIRGPAVWTRPGAGLLRRLLARDSRGNLGDREEAADGGAGGDGMAGSWRLKDAGVLLQMLR